MKIGDGFKKLKYVMENDLTIKDAFNFYNLDMPTCNLKNCGWLGQTIELLIGLKNSSSNMDFEDGELKTIYSTSIKRKKIILTRKCQNINNYKRAYDSEALKKLSNILLVIIHKDKKNIYNSKIISVKLINLCNLTLFYKYIVQDYYQITCQIMYWNDKKIKWNSISGNHRCLSLMKAKNKFYFCIVGKLFDYLINGDINIFMKERKKKSPIHIYYNPYCFNYIEKFGTYMFDHSVNKHNIKLDEYYIAKNKII